MNEARRIHHVQVTMPPGGEDQARHFYGELLDLTEIEVPESLRMRGGPWFTTENFDLHMGPEPNFSPAKKAHVAYLIANLNAVADSLQAEGFPVLRDSDFPGYDRFYTEDPFGNRVEILTPSE